MAKRMTLAEIESTYPNEWVVVGDYTADDSVMVHDGVVVAHSPDAKEAHRLAREYRVLAPALDESKSLGLT
ncbi:MAG: hypothetical protein JXB32_08835, partial [Deltaproteobacteria bacterium]|nr:hypothetical protein [Deltaproteobacteria bacterium]